MCQEKWYGLIDMETLKSYLRIDHDEDDKMLDMMIEACIIDLERRSSKILRHREETMSVSIRNLHITRAGWKVDVVKAPIKQILSITVDDVEQDLDTIVCRAVNEDRESYILFPQEQKTDLWWYSKDVKISYVTGYITPPKDMQLALYMLVSDMYNNSFDYKSDVKRLMMRYKLPNIL